MCLDGLPHIVNVARMVGDAYERSPLPWLDELEAKFANLASLSTDNSVGLDNKLTLAAEHLASPPQGMTLTAPADCLKQLCNMRATRYNRHQDLDDLQKAIEWAELEMDSGQSDDTMGADRLDLLGHLLAIRFTRLGDLDDLQKAITWAELAVAVATEDDTNRAIYLDHLCENLGDRYERLESLDDLDQAILCSEEALAATTPDDIKYTQRSSHVGYWLKERYERTGSLSDLEQAVRRGEKAIAALSLDVPKQEQYFHYLSVWQGMRYERTGDLKDLEQAMLRAVEAVSMTTLDHPKYAMYLSNQATWHQRKYERIGELNDLEQAILLNERAVSATPLVSASRGGRLNSLGAAFGQRYERVGALEDLEQAILQTEAAVTATTSLAIRAIFADNLGNWLRIRYQRTGMPDDINKAITHCENVVAVTPRGHPRRPGYLNTLSNTLGLRFEQTGCLSDVEQAILHSEEALTALLPDDPERYRVLNNLASRLQMRYQRMETLADTERAILLGEEALTAQPPNHSDRAMSLFNVGQWLTILYARTRNQNDCDRAIRYLTETVEMDLARPTTRLHAARVIIPILQKEQNWERLSEITEIAVNLLPRLSSRSLRQKDQQHWMKHYSGLACCAAAAALEAGKSASDAVRILELGRGVIANLQFETRSDISHLHEQHPEIAEEFERLRDLLDSASSESKAAETTVPVSSGRHALCLKLDQTITRIRQLPNFQRFLRSPRETELMAAAVSNSIIVINISFRCDAFLVQQHSIKALELPKLQENEIREWAALLKSGKSRRSQMLKLFKWLWDVMAGPILQELGFVATTGQKPRVWWIPTGSLCHLPIHAAGYHFGDFSQTVLDRVVSSYSPSINALLYARRNKERSAQRQILENFVLTSMEKTPGSWMSDLKFAKKEIEVIGELLEHASVSTITLETPTKVQVLNELPRCKVIHFAGHGESHPTDPLKSSLLLNDWQQNPLTVEDLMAMKLHQNPPFLAYLSACSTGDNKVNELLDEGIHLMGACQLAGFQNVIGSLWEVSDSHCVQVANDVYDAMIKAQMTDQSVPLGLHNAVINLRGGHPCTSGTSTISAARNARVVEIVTDPENSIMDPSIWAAYIHMGI
jgi:hypothetical protein